MILSGSSIINKTTAKHADKIGTYRMLSNDSVNLNYPLEGSFTRCIENIDSSLILCIQDTTEFNFDSIIGKLSKGDPDIGPTSRNTIGGFFAILLLQ